MSLYEDGKRDASHSNGSFCADRADSRADRAAALTEGLGYPHISSILQDF